MKTLRMGSTGEDVRKWQFFLIGQHFYVGAVDGIFGEKSKDATIEFQKLHHLQPDGIVGNKTVGVAMTLGFGVLEDDQEDKVSQHWPLRPSFPPLVSNAERASYFGSFPFRHRPIPGNPENIEFLDDWANKNIVGIDVPQLIRIKGSARVYFHRLAVNQLINLWKDWENAGLLHQVLTWHGTFVPRFVRGSSTTLSNHAFGSAFDINYEWNRLGILPALVGQKGSVRELVEIANWNGFYWGGHFSRLDGMHFEVAQLHS